MINQTIVFYDGECPLCKREINYLKSIIDAQLISFIDISDKDFDFQKYKKSFDVLMSEIHALKSNGDWLTGMDVFREIYSFTKFKKLISLTKLPLIEQACDLIYKIFAKNRLKLTGRKCQTSKLSCKV